MVSGSFGKDFEMAVSHRRAGFLVILFAALVLCASLLLSAPSEQKRVSIYSTAADYSLAVLDRDHRDYVSLLEVLEPLGTVTAKADGSRWKFRYNNVEAEFNAGKTRARRMPAMGTALRRASGGERARRDDAGLSRPGPGR